MTARQPQPVPRYLLRMAGLLPRKPRKSPDALAKKLISVYVCPPCDDATHVANMRAWLEHNLTGAFENPAWREALLSKFAHASYAQIRAQITPLRVYPRWIPLEQRPTPRAPITVDAYVTHLQAHAAKLKGATWRQHLAATPEIDAWIRDALTQAVSAVATDASIVAPFVDRYWRSVEPTPCAIHNATRWIWQACRTSPWTPYAGPLADVVAFARCATLRAGSLVTPDALPAIANIAWEPRRGFQWAAKLRDAPSCPEFDAWITESLTHRPRMPQ